MMKAVKKYKAEIGLIVGVVILGFCIAMVCVPICRWAEAHGINTTMNSVTSLTILTLAMSPILIILIYAWWKGEL